MLSLRASQGSSNVFPRLKQWNWIPGGRSRACAGACLEHFPQQFKDDLFCYQGWDTNNAEREPDVVFSTFGGPSGSSGAEGVPEFSMPHTRGRKLFTPKEVQMLYLEYLARGGTRVDNNPDDWLEDTPSAT